MPSEIWLDAEVPAETPVIAVHYLADGDSSLVQALLAANLGSPAERDWSELSDAERAGVRAIAGADAVQCARELGRAIRAIATFRDPVSRTFAEAERDLQTADVKRVARQHEALLQQDPDRYANPQSRRLLAGAYDVSELPLRPSEEEAEEWRSRLDTAVEDYLFLVEGWLPESADRLVTTLGWRYSLPRIPEKEKVPASVRRAIDSANWLDTPLYQRLKSGFRAGRAASGAADYRATLKGGAEKGSVQPLDVYLAPAPVGPDAPVYVFQHITKTAGTAFRALLHASLADHTEFRVLRLPKEDVQKPDVVADIYANVFAGLGADERARLLWLASHSANYATPFVERPVHHVSSVREPLDRVLSRFYFAGSDEKRTRLSEQGLDRVVARKSVRPDYSNGQARSLLQPHFELDALSTTAGPPDDADLWRERLFAVAESYVLLVQDQLARSVQLLGPDWGLDMSRLARVRVNEDRPQVGEVSDEVREAIYAYNWLDLELYNLAVTRLEEVAATTTAAR